MTITLTNPIVTADVRKSDIIWFSADVIHHRAVAVVLLEDVNGAPVLDLNGNQIIRRFELTDETTPSYADWLAACPAAGNLKKQTEQFIAANLGLAGNVT